jgi:hypothetical protein
MKQQKCGQCRHFNPAHEGCGLCEKRTVIEYWDDRALTSKRPVWPDDNANGCAVYAA